MQFPLAAWTLWPSAHSSHAGHLAALAEWNVVGLDLLDRNPLLPHTTLPVKWEEWRKGQWQNHTMSVGELLFDKNAQISLISRLKIHMMYVHPSWFITFHVDALICRNQCACHTLTAYSTLQADNTSLSLVFSKHHCCTGAHLPLHSYSTTVAIWRFGV